MQNSTIIRYASYFVAQLHTHSHCNIMQEDMTNKVTRNSEWKLIVNEEVWGFIAYPRHLELLLNVHRNLVKHKQRIYLFKTDKIHKTHLCYDFWTSRVAGEMCAAEGCT